MQKLVFSWIDYLLFVLLIGLSGAVGIFYGCVKKQQTTKDYILGGRKMKIFPVAMSLVASTLSGVSLLGIPAEVYMFGAQYWLMMVSIFCLGFLVNFIYLPVFYELRLTSAFEYLELRFHKHVRTFASFLFILNNLVYLPVVIYAPSLAFNQVTGVSLHVIAPLMSFICIFYTTIGGLKAVVWADTLQFCITLCTLLCVLVLGTISVGGLGTVWEKAHLGERIEFLNMNPDPTVRVTFWTIFIGNLFIWASLVATNPPTIQRFLAVSTLSDAKRVLVIYIVFTIGTKLISCLSGLIMYAKYFECDPLTAKQIQKADQILPYYVMDVAAQIPGIGGLFIAGLFTTALSTLSTYLNCLSGLLYVDFIKPMLSSQSTEKMASNIMKLSTFGVGIMSLILVFVVEKLGSIVQLASGLSGITGGPLVGLFTMGLLFPFANAKGVTFGVMTSLLVMSVIVVQSQIHVWNNEIHHPPKPLHTYGCKHTLPANETATLPKTDAAEEPFWLFRISFYYYIFMGTLITVFVSGAVSWITRSDLDPPVAPSVVSPFVRRFLRKSSEVVRFTSEEKAALRQDAMEVAEGSNNDSTNTFN